MTDDAAAYDDGLSSLPSFTDRVSLREQVADTLRGLLISGQLRPGTLYSAPRLAAEFGVSATPVREALLDLVGEGLVEPVRNKGFRVTEVDDAALDSLAELRALIEIPIMTAVAKACTGEIAERVESLRSLAEETVAAAKAKDLTRFVTVDIDFHLGFLACHGNPYAVDVVRDLRGRSRLYGLEAMAEQGTLAQSGAEHVQMVDAALARDGREMRRLITAHLGHVRDTWAGRSPRVLQGIEEP